MEHPRNKRKPSTFVKGFSIVMGLVLILVLMEMFPGDSGERNYHWTKNLPDQIHQSSLDDLPSKETIISRLKLVSDPEIPINIVDLGLIYDLSVNVRDVFLTMTTTTPKCPLIEVLINDVKKAVFSNSSIQNLHLKLTYNPPWNVDMVSTIAMQKLLGVEPGGGG